MSPTTMGFFWYVLLLNLIHQEGFCFGYLRASHAGEHVAVQGHCAAEAWNSSLLALCRNSHAGVVVIVAAVLI